MSAARNRSRTVYACAAALAALWLYGGRADAQTVRPSHGMDQDRVIRTFILAEQLEWQPNAAERPVNVEVLSWIGGDYRRLFLRAQGEQSTLGAGGGELQADALFGRLITPFWSTVAGVRVDSRPRVAQSGRPGAEGQPASLPTTGRLTRGMVAVGLLGLAPGWFELEPTLLVSNTGDVSLEVESSFDLLLTQRLIVQPRLELNAAVQAVREIGVGSGLNDVEFGARVRYEIRRKFAPYVGLSWLRRTGATAAMAHDAGEPKSVGTITAGLRIWR
ncbi:MAG: copper resistance protein B [Gemmatimonadota bacterium]